MSKSGQRASSVSRTTSASALGVDVGDKKLERFINMCKRKEFTPIRRKPLMMQQCRREDSNLHTLNGYQVLNLARLPIPPLRLELPSIIPAQEASSRRVRCVPFWSAVARHRFGFLLATPP